MSTTTWNRKQVLTTVALATLIAVVIVQAYSIVVLLPARAGGSTSVNGVSTTTGTANTITVTGTGHSSVKPDTALVTIGVLSQGATVQAAVQDNGNTMSQVVSALNNIGIDNSNIQTNYYNVSPVYSSNTGQPPTITGYQVSNQIQVTILASGQSIGQFGTKVGQVIDTAVSSGANQLNGIQFTASQNLFQQAEQSALTDAGKDASQKAHTIASAMGVTITGLVSVTLGSNYNPPIYTSGVVALSASTTIVAPQSLAVSETVQAVYSIG
jgi:uncharacterized protein